MKPVTKNWLGNFGTCVVCFRGAVAPGADVATDDGHICGATTWLI